MKIRRKRMYNIDPRFRKEVRYSFAARRHNGFTPVNREGHSRALIVAHGYGPTPEKARLAARKTRKRVHRPRPKSARALADDRRYSEYVRVKYENMRRVTPRERAVLQKWRSCEHDWQETLPQSYSFAERCTLCGSKRGIKPGRPDSLRDYF